MNIKSILQFAIGPIGVAAIGFLTLPLTTWFFSPEDIGRISLLNITISFSVMFFSLGLDQAYVREYHESPNTSLLWKTCFLPGAIILIIFSFLVLLNPKALSIAVFDKPLNLYGISIILCILLSYCIRFFSLILRMQERGLAFSLSQILSKLIYLLIIGFFIFLSDQHDIHQLLIATTLSILFITLFFSWNTRQEWARKDTLIIDKEKLHTMLHYSIPLFFSGITYWGINSLDRIMLKKFSTLEELGFFSVAMSFASVAFIFQSVFSTVWAPIVYKWLKNKDDMRKVFHISKYTTIFILLLFSLAGLFSWIVDYILPDKYSTTKYLIVSCLGIPLFYTLSETTVVGINITRKTNFAFLATLLALIFGIALNYFLIPIFGANGAAVASCWTFYLFFILRTEFSCFVWQQIPRLSIYLTTFIVVILSSATTLLNEQYRSLLLILWGTVFIYTSVKLYCGKDKIFNLKSGYQI